MVTNRKELWEAGKSRAEENVGALDKNTEIWSDVFKLTAVLATAVETSELECCSCFILLTSPSLATFLQEMFPEPCLESLKCFVTVPSPGSALHSCFLHSVLPTHSIENHSRL